MARQRLPRTRLQHVGLLVCLTVALNACENRRAAQPNTEQSHDPDNARQSDSDCIELGTFELESGELIVSDPCYHSDSELSSLHGRLSHAKNGRWQARVKKAVAGDWGNRCIELIINHETSYADISSWNKTEALIGVDSGQTGFFDVQHFGESADVPKGFEAEKDLIDPTDLWYSLCCRQTLSELGAGVVPFGVVSSSGLGDGGYELYSHEVNGKTVAARLVFISNEELRELQE